MKIRQILSLVFLALLGCTERIQEGGFETGDLQARVLHPDGTPVPAARVWLVRSRGDSAPATVVDSALTDTAGRARFLYGTDADLAGMGLDARSGDSLGMAPSVFARATAANVTIRETKSVQIGRDSAGGLPSLHVPGSHFASRAAENGGAAVLALPRGTWDLAIRTPTKAQVVRALAVTRDTVLAGVAGVPASLQDSSPKTPDTLRDGPDIALDSFRVEGIAQYVDTSLPPAWAWEAADSSLVRRDLDGAVLSSTRSSKPFYVGFAPGTAMLNSPDLPSTGTLAVSLSYPVAPSSDTTFGRRFQFFDSSGNGASLFLFGTAVRQRDTMGIVPYDGRLTDSSWKRVDTSALLDAEKWYFSWGSNFVKIRNAGGLMGAVQLMSAFHGPPQLKIFLFGRGSDTASIRITKTRLYKPR